MKPYVVDGQMIVDVAKGIEEDTLMTLVSADQPGDSAGGRSSAQWTDTCRRSRKKASNILRDRCKDKKDSRVLAVCI